MFNFTTTTLIHSLDLFVANPTNVSAGLIPSSAMLNPSNNTFWVNGVNLFRKENVVAIYRNPYVDPLAGRLVVDAAGAFVYASAMGLIPNGVSKVLMRLKFYIRRSGDANSYYANDTAFKGKDFVYEWIMTPTTANATIAKQIKKINRFYDDVYFDVHLGTTKDDQVLIDYDSCESGTSTTPTSTNESLSGVEQGGEDSPATPEPATASLNENEVSEADKIVFVSDNYGLFTDAVLQVWVDGHSDCCTYQEGGWIDIAWLSETCRIPVCNCSTSECDGIYRTVKNSEQTSTKNSTPLLHTVDCVNGVGTYQQILRDLRLPTMENLAYGSLTQQMNEMPVPGNKYVQYTLHYVTCRGILGGSAVGEITHSKTTHVFFVPADCCACASGLDAAFMAALNEAFDWTVCEEGRLVSAPHDDPTVHPSLKGQLRPANVASTRTSNDTAPAALAEESSGEEESGSQSESDDESFNENNSLGGGDVPGMPNFGPGHSGSKGKNVDSGLILNP